MPYLPNPGHRDPPPETEIWTEVDGERQFVGHRAVHVRLFNGFDSKAAGHAPWPAAGGRPAETRWVISRTPHPFEIKEFLPV